MPSKKKSIQVAFNRGETRIDGSRDDKMVCQQFGDAMIVQEQKINEILK